MGGTEHSEEDGAPKVLGGDEQLESHYRGNWSPELPSSIDYNQHGYVPGVLAPTYFLVGLSESRSIGEVEDEEAPGGDGKRRLVRKGAIIINPKATPLLEAVFAFEEEKARQLLKPEYLNAPENLLGYTPVIVAAQTPNDDLALSFTSMLVEAGADVNHCATDGMNAFLSAVLMSNMKTLKYLESKGVDLRQTQQSTRTQGKTGMHIASEKGNLPVMQYLHAKGVPADSYFSGQTKDGYTFRMTPLFLASEKGYLDVVEWLLSVGADASAPCALKKTADGISPIHQAAMMGRLEILKLFKEKGYYLDEPRGEIQFTPLLTASQNGHLSVVQYLMSCGVNINHVTPSGTTAFYMAIQGGHVDVVEYLSQYGVPVEYSVSSALSKTPLMAACCLTDDEKALRIAQLLVERGANVHARIPNGSALLFTAVRGLPQTARFLLNAGADPNVVTEVDNTHAAYLAAARGHTSVLQVLSEFNADLHKVVHYKPPGQKNHTSLTSLFVAAQNGHVEAVHFLLNHGARVDQLCDVSDRNRRLTPLHQAAMLGNTEVVKLFCDIRCNLDPPGLSTGDSPLSVAATLGKVDVVKTLLEGKANPNYVRKWDPARATPLYMAAQMGHLPVVRALLEGHANPNQHVNIPYRVEFMNMTPRRIAHQKKFTEIEALLERAEKREDCTLM